MRTYKLHLIRHGLTEANSRGLYAGDTELSLSEEGIMILKDLAENCGYPPVEEVYSSPRVRCLETAELLYPGYRPVVIDGLKEVSFGKFEGKSAADLAGDRDFDAWVESGYRSVPPGGEKAVDFHERCRQGFEAVLSQMMKKGIFTAAVITHGAVIMNIMAAFSVNKRSFLDWQLGAGEGFTVVITPQLWMSGHIFEVRGMVPEGLYEEDSERDYDLVDIPEVEGEEHE